MVDNVKVVFFRPWVCSNQDAGKNRFKNILSLKNLPVMNLPAPSVIRSATFSMTRS